MDETRGSLKALQDAVAKLAAAEASQRLSMSPPNGTIANTGRVMLVNLYSEELLFIINGASYRVPANKSRMIENVPTGTLRYEVFADRWGSLENRITTLAAGDTFTLSASNPR